MKLRYTILLSVTSLIAGCSPSTSTNTSFDFTRPNANSKGNVSEIYQLLPTSGSSWSGIDIKWLDSTKTMRSLSGYAGRAVILSFWANDNTQPVGAQEEPSLDSTQRDLGDSVGIVTIEEKQNLTTDYNYAVANGITVQILVDSSDRTQIEYLSAVNGSGFFPETFVLKPNGSIMTWNYAVADNHQLDSLARAAYK